MAMRSWKVRVQDILDAIAEIKAFTEAMSFDEFRSDIRSARAVQMDFIVIGEAANAIPQEIQDAHPGVPWHLMRAMRNRLVHAYFAVDPRIIWDTIQIDLPQLVEPLRELLAEPQ